MPIERMDEFFAARVGDYDEHMLSEVEGCREGYIKMASLLPEKTESILDLGCGTGLELDEIFKRLPNVRVTGIDLTRAMLDTLRAKHPDKAMTLVCGDYFEYSLGEEIYDAAVSFQSLHHFVPERKSELYRRIYRSLKPGGMYIECDYMVEKDEEEAFFFKECDRLRCEAKIPSDVYCHYDTPCTVNHQISRLRSAGFSSVDMLLRIGNTTLLLSKKGRDGHELS